MINNVEYLCKKFCDVSLPSYSHNKLIDLLGDAQIIYIFWINHLLKGKIETEKEHEPKRERIAENTVSLPWNGVKWN